MFFYIFENNFHDFLKIFFMIFFEIFFIKIGSGGVFFQSAFNVKTHVQVHFTIASQFYVYVDVEIFLHVFMHLYSEKNRYVKNFLKLL